MSTLSIPNTTRVSTGFAKGCRVGLDEKLTAQEAAQYGQIPDKMEYIYNSSFATMMLEDADAPAEAIAPRLHIPSSMAFDCVNEKACVSKTLSAQDEVSHFLRYNYARYRTSGLLNERQRGESAGLARKILLWHRRATELRTALTEANVGLVLAMAKRVHNEKLDFADLVSEASMALLRCIDKFDASRGYKFSTYACRAMLKALSRLGKNSILRRKRFPTGLDSDTMPTRQIAGPDASLDDIDAVREVIAGNRAMLSDLERTVIVERFSLVSRDKGKTLSQVGSIVGLCNERVRQIQNDAFEKIRTALEGKAVAA